LTTLGAALLPTLLEVEGVTDIQLVGRELPASVMRRIADARMKHV
jgi:hypothetical protein